MGINKYFSHTFENRLIDSFWQNNNSEIASLSQNRLYRHLNTENITYLSKLENNFIRMSLTRLRLGSHNLLIERGRWNNTLHEERKCILCDEIEDEFHFVCTCVKFYDLRIKYLPKALYIRPSMQKFVDYLSSNNIKQLKKIGTYLFHAFKQYTVDEILA